MRERLLEAGHAQIDGGFLGGMTNEKYAKMTGASKATATHDLADLLVKRPAAGGRRGQGYTLRCERAQLGAACA